VSFPKNQSINTRKSLKDLKALNMPRYGKIINEPKPNNSALLLDPGPSPKLRRKEGYLGETLLSLNKNP